MSFIGQGYNPPNPPQPAPPPAPAPLRAAPPSAPKYPAVRPWLFWTMFGCSAALLLSVFLPWVSASVGTVQVSGNGLGGVNSLLPAQGQGLGDGVFLLPVALLALIFALVGAIVGRAAWAWAVAGFGLVATVFLTIELVNINSKLSALTSGAATNTAGINVSAGTGIGLYLAWLLAFLILSFGLYQGIEGL